MNKVINIELMIVLFLMLYSGFLSPSFLALLKIKTSRMPSRLIAMPPVMPITCINDLATNKKIRRGGMHVKSQARLLLNL